MINSCLKRFEKKWGFTLIELLVVISIIGILTALGAVSFTNARRASRDTRRLGDIKNVVTALEQYYNTCRAYPRGNPENEFHNSFIEPTSWVSEEGGGGGGKCAGDTSLYVFRGTGQYMDKLPIDPQNNSSCAIYEYKATGGGSGFEIKYGLERQNNSQALGNYDTTCGSGSNTYYRYLISRSG